MPLRNIVKIDQALCNGCGLCVTACAEGAIAIVDGKARLVSEVYCDGLGACLGHCPQGAISVEQREAAEFDEKATHEHLAQQKEAAAIHTAVMCPGLMAHAFAPPKQQGPGQGPVQSQLRHWPVQLRLVSHVAPYFRDADLLLCADCVPFAMGDFHTRFLKDRSVAVGCPKLDDPQFYVDKLSAILSTNKCRSLTVVHMEVPCCSGLTRIAKEAIRRSGTAPQTFQDVTIGLQGNVLRIEDIVVQ